MKLQQIIIQNTSINCLILVIKELNNRLFLLKTKNYSIEIDRKYFYDQPINDLIRHYDEISTEQGDDYTTSCLLNFAYIFLKKIQIKAADLSKAKALDADSRAFQQIFFYWYFNNNSNGNNLLHC